MRESVAGHQHTLQYFDRRRIEMGFGAVNKRTLKRMLVRESHEHSTAVPLWSVLYPIPEMVPALDGFLASPQGWVTEIISYHCSFVLWKSEMRNEET